MTNTWLGVADRFTCNFSAEFELDRKYTLSYKTSSEDVIVELWVNGVNGVHIGRVINNSITFISPISGIGDITLVAAEDIAIEEVKLEKGNKATDWTPAPEDVQANIDAVATEIQVTNGSISTIISATELRTIEGLGTTFYNQYNTTKSTVDSWEMSLDSHTTTFTDLLSSVETNNTKISATPDTIKASVTSSYISGLESISTMKASIELNKSSITSKVEKDGIISTINQSPEIISIKANKIELEGLVTANEKFKILQDGSIEAVDGVFSGTINGTTINGTTIVGGDIYGASLTVGGNQNLNGTLVVRDGRGEAIGSIDSSGISFSKDIVVSETWKWNLNIGLVYKAEFDNARTAKYGSTHLSLSDSLSNPQGQTWKRMFGYDLLKGGVHMKLQNSGGYTEDWVNHQLYLGAAPRTKSSVGEVPIGNIWNSDDRVAGVTYFKYGSYGLKMTAWDGLNTTDKSSTGVQIYDKVGIHGGLDVTGGVSAAGGMDIYGGIRVAGGVKTMSGKDYVYLYDSGTNWKQYSDGTMVVEVSKSTYGSINTAWGSLYYLSVGTISFPKTFIGSPSVTFTNTSDRGLMFGYTIANTNSINTVELYRSVSDPQSYTYSFTVRAVGRWQ